jgi:hypothetical protein
MSSPETIPDRASDAGPEARPRDWYEWLCEAEDLIKVAKVMPDMRQIPNADRVSKIREAMQALQEAQELLS